MEFLKDIVVLIFLIYSIRRRLQIGHVLLLSALLFGLLHRIPLLKLGDFAYGSFLSPDNLTILAALIMINMMEYIMRVSGSQSRLVSGLKKVSGDSRFTMAALASIVGMLPSPGGARFSAPLVEEAGKGLQIDAEASAAVNFHYRHIWEFILPLYPANLLAVVILKISFAQFVVVMLPYTLISVVAGLLLFKNVKLPAGEQRIKPDRQAWLGVAEGLAPIAVIMLLVLALKVHVLLSLLAATVSMLILYRIPFGQYRSLLKAGFNFRVLYMVFAAIYFRDVLIKSGSIEQLMAYLQNSPLNPLVVPVLLALVMGLLTGMTVPGITVGLPLVMAMASPDNVLALGGLAFAACMVGVDLSPAHLCLVLSVEHFRADFGKTFRRLLLPNAIVLLFAIIYSLII